MSRSPRAALAAAAKLAALALAGGLVGLALAEGTARLVWQAPWYERLLTEQMRHQKHPYRLNSLGLRDAEIAPRPPGQRRVLVLGDSFTFGLGVKDPEAVFPSLLEQRLVAGSSDSVEVLNAGIPGSLTGDWVALWEKLAERFDPDVVLIVFFLRDGTQVSSIPDFFGAIRREIAFRNHNSQAYQRSYLVRLWRDWRDRREVARLYSRRFHAAYFGDAAETAEWQRARANLLALRDAARARGARVGLVVFPMLVELDEGYPFRDIGEAVAGFGQESGIPTHDLLQAFLGRQGPDLWVSPMDQHPNAQAHALAAESLLPFVAGLLEPEGR